MTTGRSTISNLLPALKKKIAENVSNVDIVEDCQKWENIFATVEDENMVINVEYDSAAVSDVFSILQVNRDFIYQQIGFTEPSAANEENNETIAENGESIESLFSEINDSIDIDISASLPPGIVQQQEDEMHVSMAPGMALQHEEAITINDDPTPKVIVNENTVTECEKVVTRPEVETNTSAESNIEMVKRMMDAAKEQSTRLIDCIGEIATEQFNSSHKVLDAILIMDERHSLMQRQLQMTLEALTNNREDMQLIKGRLANIDKAVCMVANYNYALKNMTIPKIFDCNDKPTIEVLSNNENQFTDKGHA